MDKNVEEVTYSIVRLAFALAAAFLSLFPIYWMFTMSIKPPLEWAPAEVHWWPWSPTTTNYLALFFPKTTLLEWGLVRPSNR